MIFFDLDGVLANFVAGAFAAHGKSIPIETVEWGFPAQLGFEGVNDPKFWEPFGHSFWENLAPYDDGLSLLRAAEGLIGPDQIGLLSSPCDTAGCVDGKRAWVGRYLPCYRRRLFLGSAKELFAGRNKVLVDDHDPNCEKFAAAGGQVVTPPRPWNRRKAECTSGGGFGLMGALVELERAVEAAWGGSAS